MCAIFGFAGFSDAALLRRMAADAKATLNIPGRYVVCATPETLDLVQTLVETRKQLASR